MSEKMKKASAILSISLYLLLCGVVFYYMGRPLVQFFGEPEKFRVWVGERGLYGEFLYTLMVALQVIVAIIPGGPVEIAGGYAFGVWKGTVLILLGIQIGASCTFLLSKRFGTKLMEVFYKREKIENLRFLKDKDLRDTLVFILYLVPGAPKDLLSYFCGLTGMSFTSHFILSLIARIPAVVASAYAGSALGEKSYGRAALIITLVFLCSIAGGIFYRELSVRRNRKANKTADRSQLPFSPCRKR